MTQVLTLKQATDKALTEHWDGTRNYSTVKSNVKTILETLGTETLLADVDDRAVARFVAELKKRNLNPTTVNRKLSTLQTVLRLAREDWGIKAQAPRFKRFRSKEKNGRIRVFSQAEEDRLVSLASELDADVGDLLVVLFDTGMRLSEALRLEARDVDFQTGMLSIWTTKNDVPRSIRMTGRVTEILRRRAHNRHIFTMPDHHVKYIFRLVRTRAGYSGDSECVIHAIRHTVASRLVQRGVPLYTVQKWMGHSSIQVTERYAHLSPAQFAEAASVLERSDQVPPSYKP